MFGTLLNVWNVQELDALLGTRVVLKQKNMWEQPKWGKLIIHSPMHLKQLCNFAFHHSWLANIVKQLGQRKEVGQARGLAVAAQRNCCTRARRRRRRATGLSQPWRMAPQRLRDSTLAIKQGHQQYILIYFIWWHGPASKEVLFNTCWFLILKIKMARQICDRDRVLMACMVVWWTCISACST